MVCEVILHTLNIDPIYVNGLQDFRHYRLRIKVDYNIPLELAVSQIEKKWWTWEVKVDTEAGLPNGDLIAFVWLKDEEEMMELSNYVDILGYRCSMTHAFMFKCNLCGNQGHREEDCNEAKEAIRSLEAIEREKSKLAQERFRTTQLYYCRVETGMENIITNMQVEESSLKIKMRKGVYGELECFEEPMLGRNVQVALKSLMIKLSKYSFALCVNEDECYMGFIQRRRILVLNISEGDARVWKMEAEEPRKIESLKRKLDWTESTMKKLKTSNKYIQLTVEDCTKKRNEESVGPKSCIKIVHLNICGFERQTRWNRADAEGKGHWHSGNLWNSSEWRRIYLCSWLSVNWKRDK
ncbi:unnamed protein product [Blepharisma stoltei]|uniref:CCHC-type domain-containing protein n=1 Tax=Blepharisma stoltei TaxID=1481888 RepID=A0AAU9ING9_9CILI|nr:unnamed protein product [Blepharisma stoltei]